MLPLICHWYLIHFLYLLCNSSIWIQTGQDIIHSFTGAQNFFSFNILVCHWVKPLYVRLCNSKITTFSHQSAQSRLMQKMDLHKNKQALSKIVAMLCLEQTHFKRQRRRLELEINTRDQGMNMCCDAWLWTHMFWCPCYTDSDLCTSTSGSQSEFWSHAVHPPTSRLGQSQCSSFYMRHRPLQNQIIISTVLL